MKRVGAAIGGMMVAARNGICQIAGMFVVPTRPRGAMPARHFVQG